MSSSSSNQSTRNKNISSTSSSNRSSRSYSTSRSRSSSRYQKHSSRNRRITSSRSVSRSPLRYNNRHQKSNQIIEPCQCIGIFGMSRSTVEDILWDTFEKFGKINSVRIIMDRYKNESLGYGFINFDVLESASRAVKEANGMCIDGRCIRVDYSITKKAHTPTPGMYKGKPSNRRSGNYHNDRYDNRRDRYRNDRYDRYDKYDRKRRNSYSSRSDSYDRYKSKRNYNRDRCSRSRSNERQYSPRY